MQYPHEISTTGLEHYPHIYMAFTAVHPLRHAATQLLQAQAASPVVCPHQIVTSPTTVFPCTQAHVVVFLPEGLIPDILLLILAVFAVLGMG